MTIVLNAAERTDKIGITMKKEERRIKMVANDGGDGEDGGE